MKSRRPIQTNLDTNNHKSIPTKRLSNPFEDLIELLYIPKSPYYYAFKSGLNLINSPTRKFSFLPLQNSFPVETSNIQLLTCRKSPEGAYHDDFNLNLGLDRFSRDDENSEAISRRDSVRSSVSSMDPANWLQSLVRKVSHGRPSFRKLSQHGIQKPAVPELREVVRRKSCHCSDCGGMSSLEKRTMHFKQSVLAAKAEQLKPTEDKKPNFNNKFLMLKSPASSQFANSFASKKNHQNHQNSFKRKVFNMNVGASPESTLRKEALLPKTNRALVPPKHHNRRSSEYIKISYIEPSKESTSNNEEKADISVAESDREGLAEKIKQRLSKGLSFSIDKDKQTSNPLKLNLLSPRDSMNRSEPFANMCNYVQKEGTENISLNKKPPKLMKTQTLQEKFVKAFNSDACNESQFRRSSRESGPLSSNVESPVDSLSNGQRSSWSPIKNPKSIFVSVSKPPEEQDLSAENQLQRKLSAQSTQKTPHGADDWNLNNISSASESSSSDNSSDSDTSVTELKKLDKKHQEKPLAPSKIFKPLLLSSKAYSFIATPIIQSAQNTVTNANSSNASPDLVKATPKKPVVKRKIDTYKSQSQPSSPRSFRKYNETPVMKELYLSQAAKQLDEDSKGKKIARSRGERKILNSLTIYADLKVKEMMYKKRIIQAKLDIALPYKLPPLTSRERSPPKELSVSPRKARLGSVLLKKKKKDVEKISLLDSQYKQKEAELKGTKRSISSLKTKQNSRSLATFLPYVEGVKKGEDQRE